MEQVSAPPRTGLGAGRVFLLGGLTLGHAIIHWYQQSFVILLPEIKRTLGLDPVQVGALSSVRAISGGAANLPAGFISDLFRRQGALVLAVSMAWIGLAYLLVGIAPTYALLLPAVALVGMGGAIWHPPAIGLLSRRWADRRGFAVAVHGVGGSIGDTLAPLAVGILLLVFFWRNLLHFYAIPAVVLALGVWWFLRSAYQEGGERPTLRGYFGAAGKVLTNKVILVLLVVAGVRAMGQQAILTFLPIYLREDFQYSSAFAGLMLSVLTLMGIASQPALGWLSDRFGRKAVLVPGLALLALFALLLAWARPGWELVSVVVILGLFFYALQATILAAAMDATAQGAEATSVSLIFGGTFIFSSVSPVIAGAVAKAWGITSVFYYAAALYVLCVVLTLPLRLRRGT
ncbi:MAG: MFS transporter [Dehalococcoidia bacterium]|nr:MFS transporter [Dehalococcoidia bacterium]MDW8119363.1 MFS transporter [Chloroflexota bacterium]